MSGVTADPAWVLDKKVPIALILAILGQTAAGVWWAANISARVNQSEVRVRVLESADQKAAEINTRVAESLASFKASQEAMKNAIDRIERTLDARRRD
jgi:hypothetical protein